MKQTTYFFLAIMIFLMLTVSGCSIFGGDDEEIAPAPDTVEATELETDTASLSIDETEPEEEEPEVLEDTEVVSEELAEGEEEIIVPDSDSTTRRRPTNTTE